MFDTELLINSGGLLVIFLAVYGQTGLFFCFFLPSGGLMFTAGVLIASGRLHYSLFTVCSLLVLAAILGNGTGYWFGRKAGPLLYKKDSRFLKIRHLQTAEYFYKRHGGPALAASLFFPIMRTFSPIIAGMIKLSFGRFLFFVFIGSLCWVLSFVLSGYFIASMPFLKPYLKYVILAILLLVTGPIVYRIVKEFKKKRQVNE